jgi:hypothetical protein
MIQKILHKQTNFFYQAMLLCIIYIEFPLILALVIIGVRVIDVYHISLILWFVLYMISPKFFNKSIIVLLIYANLFLLETYIYTLVEKDIES